MSLQIPSDLLPVDGRFGSGPAKIRDEALASLSGAGRDVIGTSHRQRPVRELVGRIRSRLSEVYGLPVGYEVVLGNGGSTLFWDAAVASLIEQRSAHAVFGEFSAKFAAATRRAPYLADPTVTEVAAGSAVLPEPTEGVDVYAWAHNETSTGVIAPVRRVADHGLMVVDGTSAAGGVEIDAAATDVYYFAPQKCLGSDGGLWLAFCSPAAIEQIERIAATDRWIPESLSLQLALANSRLDQTLNTPAITTLWLLADQLDWIAEHGGLPFSAGRSRASADTLYGWAEACPVAEPFAAAEHRSPVVGTIDFAPEVDAAGLAATLRANGVVDTEPYRKLGRNQLRIGMYPTVDPDDVAALTRCLDWLLERQG